MHVANEAHPLGGGRTELDLGAIFRAHGEAFRAQFSPSQQQIRVMRAIERCRTAALGGHLYGCTREGCDFVVPAYNSCRDRHCPKCQGKAQFEWIEARKERLLHSSYFHVVFTLPSELRALAQKNSEAIYGLLLSSAAGTLIDLGRDEKRLGALIGVTAILHTWTRTLAYHPHAHCIVTAGGLAPDGGRWISIRGDFLFPVKVMGALFRGKFLAGLKKLHETKSLVEDAETSFDALINVLYKTSWVVYAKQPFGGPVQVFSYLGRYTHRVGIANSRLRSADDKQITFDTKDAHTITLAPFDFIQRFLQHVLPSGFVKIRHYGLHASVNAKTKLVEAQALLGPLPDLDRDRVELVHPAPKDDDTETLLRLLRDGVEVLCPRCRRGHLRPIPGGPDPP